MIMVEEGMEIFRKNPTEEIGRKIFFYPGGARKEKNIPMAAR